MSPRDPDGEQASFADDDGRLEIVDGDEDAPIAAYRAFRREGAAILLSLREEGGLLHGLEAGAWHVFRAIAMCWGRSELSPTHRTLMTLAGCSERAVTRHLRTLHDAGTVRVIRTEGVSQTYRIGARLVNEVCAVASQRDPRLWPFATMAGAATPAIVVTVEAHDGDTRSATPANLSRLREETRPRRSRPDAGSASPLVRSPLKTKESLRSSSSLPEERAVACGALAALFRRLHPDQPLPRSFAPSDISVVVECTAGGTWTAESLESLHRDAIEGAMTTSRGRPPTIRYIWGRQEHFLAHARQGRSLRVAAGRRPVPHAKPPEPEPTIPLPELAATLGALLQRLDGPPLDPLQPTQPTQPTSP